MEPYFQDPFCTLYQGEALDVLRGMEDGLVQCCVTSPPYWGLRDYGVSGQLGMEKTPEEYIEKVVAIFREVKRVLMGDGTCWINLGDSYTSGGRKTWNAGDNHLGQHEIQHGMERPETPAGLKPKDLVMMPARVAIALQADGWYLRSDIIEQVELYCPCGCGYILEERIWRYSQDKDIVWKKKNPMPESVTDRPTTNHEHIFLLSKNPKYYYDAEAIREPVTGGAHTRGDGVNPKARDTGVGFGYADKNPKPRRKQNESFSSAVRDLVSSRNKRSVWEIATQPYSEAHFATFPEELPRTCILAGTKTGDIVLDMFSGSGTTGKVANELGRRYIGGELNPEYLKLHHDRMVQIGMAL